MRGKRAETSGIALKKRNNEVVPEKVAFISGSRANRIKVEIDEGKIYARKISWVTRAEVSGRSYVNNEETIVSEGVKMGFARRVGVPAAP